MHFKKYFKVKLHFKEKSLNLTIKSSKNIILLIQFFFKNFRLQRYCETLIFKEPIECGKKAEEILWRRVFYEIINIVKANKKVCKIFDKFSLLLPYYLNIIILKNLKSNTQIETMYRLHLTSAYGFYNHLMLKFQSEFNTFIQLDGFLDFPVINFEKQTKSKPTNI
jgi:hypothetical protein